MTEYEKIIASDVLLSQLEQVKFPEPIGGLTEVEKHTANLLRIIAAALITLIRK